MGSVRVVKGGILASASLLSNFVFIQSLLYYFEVFLIKLIKHNYIYTVLLLLIITLTYMYLSLPQYLSYLYLTLTLPYSSLLSYSSFIPFFLYSSSFFSFSSSSSRRLAPKHFHLSPHKKCLGAQTECPVGRRILSKACNQSHQELPRYANYATCIQVFE